MYTWGTKSTTFITLTGDIIKRGGACGHAMASFDGHLCCARCWDKGKGKDTCVEDKESTNCLHCNALTREQKAQLATPSYKLKKEKREAKKLEMETSKDSESLVDPSSISVLGVVDNAGVATVFIITGPAQVI